MKQLYIIGFLLFFSGLCGCYEDKGNYDYTETFEITIDSLKESYTLYALVDTLRISPEVSPVNAEYDFHWCVYQTNVQGYAPKLDTIATTRELVYPMTLDPGSYQIVCMATGTGYGHYPDRGKAADCYNMLWLKVGMYFGRKTVIRISICFLQRKGR